MQDWAGLATLAAETLIVALYEPTTQRDSLWSRSAAVTGADGARRECATMLRTVLDEVQILHELQSNAIVKAAESTDLPSVPSLISTRLRRRARELTSLWSTHRAQTIRPDDPVVVLWARSLPAELQPLPPRIERLHDRPTSRASAPGSFEGIATVLTPLMTAAGVAAVIGASNMLHHTLSAERLRKETASNQRQTAREEYYGEEATATENRGTEEFPDTGASTGPTNLDAEITSAANTEIHRKILKNDADQAARDGAKVVMNEMSLTDFATDQITKGVAKGVGEVSLNPDEAGRYRQERIIQDQQAKADNGDIAPQSGFHGQRAGGKTWPELLAEWGRYAVDVSEDEVVREGRRVIEQATDAIARLPLETDISKTVNASIFDGSEPIMGSGTPPLFAFFKPRDPSFPLRMMDLGVPSDVFETINSAVDPNSLDPTTLSQVQLYRPLEATMQMVQSGAIISQLGGVTTTTLTGATAVVGAKAVAVVGGLTAVSGFACTITGEKMVCTMYDGISGYVNKALTTVNLASAAHRYSMQRFMESASNAYAGGWSLNPLNPAAPRELRNLYIGAESAGAKYIGSNYDAIASGAQDAGLLATAGFYTGGYQRTKGMLDTGATVAGAVYSGTKAVDDNSPMIKYGLGLMERYNLYRSLDMPSYTSEHHYVAYMHNQAAKCAARYTRLVTDLVTGGELEPGTDPIMESAFLTLDECQGRMLGALLRRFARDIVTEGDSTAPPTVPADTVIAALRQATGRMFPNRDGYAASRAAVMAEAAVRRFSQGDAPGQISFETMGSIALYVTQGSTVIGRAVAVTEKVPADLASVYERQGEARYRCAYHLVASDKALSDMCAPGARIEAFDVQEGAIWESELVPGSTRPFADDEGAFHAVSFVGRESAVKLSLSLGTAKARRLYPAAVNNRGPGDRKLLDHRMAGEMQTESESIGSKRVPLDLTVAQMAKDAGRRPDVKACPSTLAAGVAAWWIDGTGDWPTRPPPELIAAILAEDRARQQELGELRGDPFEPGEKTTLDHLWGLNPNRKATWTETLTFKDTSEPDTSHVTWAHVASLGSADPTLLLRTLQGSRAASSFMDAALDDTADGTGHSGSSTLRVRRLRPALARTDEYARIVATRIALTRSASTADKALADLASDIRAQRDIMANPLMMYMMGVSSKAPEISDEASGWTSWLPGASSSGESGQTQSIIEAVRVARSRRPDLYTAARAAFLDLVGPFDAVQSVPDGGTEQRDAARDRIIQQWLAAIADEARTGSEGAGLDQIRSVYLAATVERVSPLTTELIKKARVRCAVASATGAQSGHASANAGQMILDIFRCASRDEMELSDHPLPEPNPRPPEPSPWDDAGRDLMRIVAAPGSRETLYRALQTVAQKHGPDAALMAGATYSALLGGNAIGSLVDHPDRAASHFAEWEKWVEGALRDSGASERIQRSIRGLPPGLAYSTVCMARSGAKPTMLHLRTLKETLCDQLDAFFKIADKIHTLPASENKDYSGVPDVRDLDEADRRFPISTIDDFDSLNTALRAHDGHYYATLRLQRLRDSMNRLSSQMTDADKFAVGKEEVSLAIEMGKVEAVFRTSTEL